MKTTANALVLNGCAPVPLAHYLKALGILRLVSEQKDADCRGAWRNDRFVLLTRLTRSELEQFFLEEYRPTAIIDPWNGGSGFYPKDNKKGLLALMASEDPRLRDLQAVVTWAQSRTTGWAEAPSEAAKAEFQALCAAQWRGSAQDALSAAIVIGPQPSGKGKELKVSYPAMLGTGWNDGRLDFANNFHQRLAELFDLGRKRMKTAEQETAAVEQQHETKRHHLSLALWRDASSDLRKTAIGQYMPGSAGGANSTTGADGDSLVNPWDYILLMEGAVLFSAAATRRMNHAAQAQASAPFALRSNATGGVTSVADEYHKYGSSQQSLGRGEQWMPLWDRFQSLPELKSLFSEGRAQVKKSTVARPVDMARAISRLGVARGITAFQRYGYLERNGQANFAVPLGRIAVTTRPNARLADDLVPWLDRLHRLARDKGAPARLAQVERGLSDAMFDALTHDDAPSRWQAVLLAAVAVEQVQVAGTGAGAGPIPQLSAEWISACDDGSSAFRLAMALGSAAAGYSHAGKPFDSIRHHWLPLDPAARRFAVSGKLLTHDVRVVAHGRDSEEDLLALLDRRALESAQKERRHPQLVSAYRAEAHPADLAAWLGGEVDVVRCTTLARAFFALDWPAWMRSRTTVKQPSGRGLPDDAWIVLRLNALPWPLDAERDIPFDPAIGRRLAAGDLSEAVRLALRRLESHGLRPPLRMILNDPGVARRWGAALVFPISVGTAHRLFDSLAHTTTKEKRHVR